MAETSERHVSESRLSGSNLAEVLIGESAGEVSVLLPEAGPTAGEPAGDAADRRPGEPSATVIDLSELPANEVTLPGPGRFPGLRRPFRSLWWLIYLGIGAASLFALLSLAASYPVLNFFVLGCLLAGQAGVARAGRLRDGFPLLTLAPRLGVIAVGLFVFLLPLRLLSWQIGIATVIRNNSPAATDGLRLMLTSLQAVILLHLTAAILCGGSWYRFIRPIRNVRDLLSGLRSGDWWRQANLVAEAVLKAVQPWNRLKLGIYGAVGAMIWLAGPAFLLTSYSAPGRTGPGYGFLSVAGGAAMMSVAAVLPALQIHQAVTGRFLSIFHLRSGLRVIRRAPWAWAFSTVVLYVFCVPLYLAKIKLPPADAAFLITPVFLLLMWPARLYCAWTYSRAMRREHRPSRWWFVPAVMIMVPLLAIYAGFLFATPLFSELGRRSLLDNHAFLSPLPMGIF